MAAPSEADLLAALELKFMTAAETVNTTDFTVGGSPSFEESTSLFPNSYLIYILTGGILSFL